MDAASSSQDAAGNQAARPRTRWPRWLRLPRFSVAATASFLAFAAFSLWLRVDAQFPITLFTVRAYAGLETIEVDPAFVEAGLWDLMWERVTSWNGLGSRLALFVALCVVAIVSSGIALFRLHFTGDKRGWSIHRLAVILAMLAAWSSLWLCYGQLEWWAIQQRARSALPRFKIAAEALLEHWPDKSQTLPEAGEVVVDPDRYPGLLVPIKRQPHPMHEDFGHTIERSGQGAICFKLAGAFDCQLEYHPPGGTPGSYTNAFGSQSEIRDAVSCGDSWYLVRYK